MATQSLVTPSEGVTYIHQHQIKQFNKCPRSYLLLHKRGAVKETYNWKAGFGNIIHKVIELLHGDKELMSAARGIKGKTVIEGLINTESARTIASGEYTDWNMEELAEKQADYSDAVLNYVNKSFNQDFEMLGCEIEFSYRYGDHWFAGKIDQVRKYPNGDIILADLKTAVYSKPSSQYELDADEQFTIYAKAVEILFGRRPDECWWYDLNKHIPYKKSGKWGKVGDERGDPLMITRRSEAQLRTCMDIVIDKVRYMKSAKDSGFWPVASDNCKFCAVAELCKQMNQGVTPGLSEAVADTFKDAGVNLEEYLNG